MSMKDTRTPYSSPNGQDSGVLTRGVEEPDVGGAYYALIASFSKLMESLSVAELSPKEANGVSVELQGLASELRRYRGAAPNRLADRRFSIPGRGNLLAIPLAVEEDLGNEVQGDIVLKPYHLGGGGYAHGGVLSLLFDDVLGTLVSRQKGGSRTSQLEIRYLHKSRIDVPLKLIARIDHHAARKTWASGYLLDGDRRIVEATGCFIVPKHERI